MGLEDLPDDDVILLAHVAFSRDARSFIDQLHSASLSGSVLFRTMGTKPTPLIVSAGKDLLIVEAHGVRRYVGVGVEEEDLNVVSSEWCLFVLHHAERKESLGRRIRAKFNKN